MELRKKGTRDGSPPVAGRTRSRRVLISDATPAPAAPPTTEVASDTEEATEAAPPRAQRVTRAKAKKPAAASRTGPGKRKRSVEPEVVAEGGGDEGGVSENEKPVRPKRQVKQRKEGQKTGKGVKKAATRQTAKRVRDCGKMDEDAKGENEGSDEGEGRARKRERSSVCVQVEVPAAPQRPLPRGDDEAKGENEGSDEGEERARKREGSSVFVQIEVPAAPERPPFRASSQPGQSGQSAAPARSPTSRRRSSSLSVAHAPAEKGVSASPSKEANGPRPPKRARKTSHSESSENVGTATPVAVSEGTRQPPEDEKGKAPQVEKAEVDLSESGRKATKRMRESKGSEVGVGSASSGGEGAFKRARQGGADQEGDEEKKEVSERPVEHATESIIEHEADRTIEHATESIIEHATESIIEHAAESIIEHAAESAVEDATNPVESMNITGAVEDSRDGMELNKTQGTETVGHGIDDSSKEGAVAKGDDVRVVDDSTAEPIALPEVVESSETTDTEPVGNVEEDIPKEDPRDGMELNKTQSTKTVGHGIDDVAEEDAVANRGDVSEATGAESVGNVEEDIPTENPRDGMVLNKTQSTKTVGHGIDNVAEEDAVAKRGDVRVADDSTTEPTALSDVVESSETTGAESVGNVEEDIPKEDGVPVVDDSSVAPTTVTRSSVAAPVAVAATPSRIPEFKVPFPKPAKTGANWLFRSADESLLWPLETPTSVTPKGKGKDVQKFLPDEDGNLPGFNSDSDSDGSTSPPSPAAWAKGHRLRRALQKTALMDPDAIFAGARPPMEELFREGFPSKRVPPSQCPSTHPAKPIVSERDLHQIKWRRLMLRLLELDAMRRALAKMRRKMEKPRNRLLRSLEEKARQERQERQQMLMNRKM
ncbi:hypothetical protein HK104_011172 [Borealophlyctis nickersoniae]|nr:hypothetical protein HK104_011172 [Borealophlyctis nickersoniae]